MFNPIRFARDLPATVLKGDSSARHVALALASFTDKRATAEVGIRKLAAVTGLSPRTVTLAICRLEEVGVLSVERPAKRGSRARSKYRFPVVGRPLTLSTGVSATDTLDLSTPVSATDTGCVSHAHTLDLLGENKTRAHARDPRSDDPAWRFSPGTGWSRLYQGAVNE